MRPPTWFEWLTVLAIIIGPIAAVWIQRAVDRYRERRVQRFRVYFSLMATRAQHLAAEHVRALNSIDIVFNEPGDQKIRDAWRAVMDHVETPTTTRGWDERLLDLKADLYHAMGLVLDYDFTLDHLKRKIYAPQGHQESEQAGLYMRQALMKVVTEEGVRVKIVP